MADEIIPLERNGSSQTLAMYYPIPENDRAEIGSAGSGVYPVVTPTSSLDATLLSVLTTAEKTALDAGEAQVVITTMTIPPGTGGAEVLAAAQNLYSSIAASELQQYQDRYEFTGQRFNAS